MALVNTREKMSRGKDLWLILVALVLVGISPPIYNRATETRIYRDVTRQTPFYDVIVTDQHLTRDGLGLRGTMIKRRCDYVSLDSYVGFDDGTLRSAELITAGEVRFGPDNRSPSPFVRMWGPWMIRYSGMVKPDKWIIYALHQCPGEPSIQINIFAKGEWK